jgi:hypothetical protein
MSDRAARESSPKGAIGAAAAGAGAAALATAAGACCVPIIAPLVVGVLGASGAAWAAGLKPYSPAILVASGLLLAWGFWLGYKPRPVVEDEACAARRPRSAQLVLWLAAAIWAIAALLITAPQLVNLLS